jgi:hypothetical protein
MAVQYETIRAEFERLRDCVTTDLDLIIKQPTGGNYLAASLITCTCDAIAYLWYGQPNKGDLVFAHLLPDLWAPVARNLYDAIRDGVVHTYETKSIILGARRLNLVISWGAKPHLNFSPSNNDLYVNIQRLARSLKDELGRFEADLKANADVRDTFYKSMRRDRELYPTQTEAKRWEELLSQAPRYVEPETENGGTASGQIAAGLLRRKLKFLWIGSSFKILKTSRTVTLAMAGTSSSILFT